MLARRIERDTKERGRDVDGILSQYLRYVKPAYDNFVLPSSRYADIVSVTWFGLRMFLSYAPQIVPGHDNGVAIELISTHIRRQLDSRSRKFRRKMAASLKRSLTSDPTGPPRDLTEQELGLTVIEQTPQVKVRLFFTCI